MGGGVPRLGGRKHDKKGKGKKEKRASYDAAGRINLRGILVRAHVLLVVPNHHTSFHLCVPPYPLPHTYTYVHTTPTTHPSLLTPLFLPFPSLQHTQVGNPYTDPVENLVGMIDALWGRDLIPEDVYAKWAQTCVSKDPDAYYSKVCGLVG